MARLVTIIIVAHNQLALTRRCIESIIKYTSVPYELILVDNGSEDGTLEYFLGFNWPIIHNDNNENLARAYNQAIHGASGDVYLFVHNDVVATPNWLENMIKCLEGNPEAGMVSPVTNNNPITGLPGSPTMASPEMEGFALAFNRSTPLKWFEVQSLLPGFCLLVKTEVINKVGLFDENFILAGYYDYDYDYSMRVNQAGFRLMCAGDTFVYHQGQGTIGTLPKELIHASNFDNQRNFFTKWATHNSDGVDIVIVNHNNRNNLKHCLSALTTLTHYPHRVYVVDNGSTDGSIEMLKNWPGIQVVFNCQDQGKVTAMNQGLLLGRGKYVVFLDPNLAVTANWLEPMVAAADSASEVALVGGKHVDANGTVLHAGVFGTNQAFSVRGQGQLNNPGLFSQQEDCLAVHGDCLLIKRQLLPYLGFLDESYRYICAEFDYALSIWLKGFRVVYSPSTVIHLEARDIRQDPKVAASFAVDEHVFGDKWHKGSTWPSGERLASLPQVPARKLRIVMPVLDFDRSEGVRTICYLANMLAERGHSVIILAPDGNYTFPVPLHAQVHFRGLVDPVKIGVTQQKIPGARRTPLLAKVFHPSSFPEADLIITNHVANAHSVALTGRGIPVYLVRGYEADLFSIPQQRPWRLLSQSSYYLQMKTLTVSNWLHRKLLTAHRKDSSVVNLGVDTEVFRYRERSPKPIKRIMTIVDSREFKGLQVFLEAMQLVVTQQPNIELNIVSYGPIPVVTNLSNRILQPINDYELARCYDQSDIFVNPSRSEGFGLSCLEAMASGIPLVTTDCGGVREYAQHGVNCVMVPPCQPQALAQGILTVLQDSELCRHLLYMGLATAQTYSWEKTLFNLEKYFYSLLPAPRRAKPLRLPAAKVKAAAYNRTTVKKGTKTEERRKRGRIGR